MKKDAEELLDQEIERRILEMEKADYQFAKRFSKKDYVVTAIVGVLALLGIFLGAYL